jgi:uncharacterized membrane protein (UPF0127 family)
MKLLDLILENVTIPFKNKTEMVVINNDGDKISVNCEIPTTEEEKMTGLMHRKTLCDKCGMFYDNIDGGFWMKNVKFPLEMIFINNDKIVDIKYAKSNDDTIIYPSTESNGNLEVNSGFCEKYNVSVGNEIYKS